MTRREFTKATRVAAFARSEGKCENCRSKLGPGNVEYDHIIPDALGGDNSLDNCQCLCRNCHGAKTTKTDVPVIAKTKRVSAKHIGADKGRRKAVIPGSKSSGWKRKLNGEVVKR